MENYKFITTFWQDFTIADAFGIPAIRDTYKRAFSEWKSNTKFVTELVLVLNWKLWQHYEKGNQSVAEVYNELWQQTHQWCLDNLKDEALTYYLQTTD